GVDVGRRCREGQRHTLVAGVRLEGVEQLRHALGPAILDDPLERVEPLLGFNRGDVLDVLRAVRHWISESCSQAGLSARSASGPRRGMNNSLHYHSRMTRTSRPAPGLIMARIGLG